MKIPFFSLGPSRGRDIPAFTPLELVAASEPHESDISQQQQQEVFGNEISSAQKETRDGAFVFQTAPRRTSVAGVARAYSPDTEVQASASMAETQTAAEVLEQQRSYGAANDADLPPKGSIGAILVAARRISIEDARCVFAAQSESSAPFGETAVRLGVATREDIRFALLQQFSMPCLQHGDSALDKEVVTAFQPGHELAEHLRNLRSQIVLRALNATPPLRSIAIVGADRGVGRSFIAANLATVFAQLGTRTLLVDADLVNPRQHLLFKLGNRIGLSSILAARADLSAACPVTSLPGFAVLPAGPTPPNPHDLVARPTLGQFLRRCEQSFDLILLDTPAWNEGSGAKMTASTAGAAVMLVQTGRTAAADASSISQEVANVGTQLIGVVLNRPQ